MKVEDQGLSEGHMAPDFMFTDYNGHTIRLSDFRGKKKVVIYFYPKDFTPGCTTEAIEFVRDYKKFKDQNIEIIGVSPDDAESHHRFRKKMNIPYFLAPDTENIIAKKYRVYGTKSIMGKEYFGVNRTTFLVNENGIIAKVFSKVKPLGHSQEIITAFN